MNNLLSLPVTAMIPSPYSHDNTPPWFKSPLILSLICLGLVIFATPLVIDFKTERVIHIRADDFSDSAQGYAEERQKHCQGSAREYKWNDVMIVMPFADRPETTEHIPILNSLSLLGQCQEKKRAIANQHPGTSLILLLERIQQAIDKERNSNNAHPIVVTITIQDDEPGPLQPDPDDIKHIQTLVDRLTENRGAIAFMVEDPTLRSQLDRDLGNESQVEICDFQSIDRCVNWAFKTARQLPKLP